MERGGDARPVLVEPAVAAVKPRTPGLPPTPPQRGAGDVCMEDSSATRKAHRRSRSDVPSSGMELAQPKAEVDWGSHGDGGNGDELLNLYLNLDALNSDDGDSSENGSEECGGADSRMILAPDDSSERKKDKEGVVKGNAAADEPAPAAAPPLHRHVRSLSVDSLMGKLNFASGATTTTANGGAIFSLELGGGEFTPVEMKKIMSDERLAAMALADPKRVKRVLANRQSAARSKERKMRYIVELEQKVQILQNEATTLAAHINFLQRDSASVAAQNNELRFRLHAMEQQAQLRDALNEALTGEVQRLKVATAEIGDTCSSNGLAQHNQMFQFQQQQQNNGSRR